MKDFEDWFNETDNSQIETELKIPLAICASCGKQFEFPGDIEDYDEDAEYWCGSNQWCVP